ncbi:FadR/GntR family transcriptional regulator [Thalassorhabdomicrobium marinisediminis]|uniref:FadR/GntR family transcriptional regulator n=1 Tax=Thalassorhabdomicrobium marinisediminis TaxID=2170577 RepID=UPI002490EFC3|nr:FadR/GntR family transcriptional regulator [Thalassorhabdomicrobium marinisediminis]
MDTLTSDIASARNLGKGKIASAVAIVGERIVAGEFQPDRPLPVEADLASSLNIGRSVLREAMKVLAAKGMVLARPRVGTVIQPRNNWNLFDQDVLHWMLRPKLVEPELIRDIFEARRLIEPEAARLAAANATEADRMRIRTNYFAMADSVGDSEASVQADIEFHKSVLEASDNAILIAFSPALSTILAAFFQLSIQNPEIFPENLGAHEKVSRMILSQDADGAYDAMLRVLAFTERDLSKRLGIQPRSQHPCT